MKQCIIRSHVSGLIFHVSWGLSCQCGSMSVNNTFEGFDCILDNNQNTISKMHGKLIATP